MQSHPDSPARSRDGRPLAPRIAIAALFAAALSCSSDPMSPTRSEVLDELSRTATQSTDGFRRSASGIAVSALKLGAPITDLTIVRNGSRIHFSAIVARYDATRPDYEPSVSAHTTNVIAWNGKPSGDLLWLALKDSAATHTTRGSYDATENSGVFVYFLSYMPGGGGHFGGGYDDPAHAAVTADGTTCAAADDVLSAINASSGRADCRNAAFDLGFRSTVTRDAPSTAEQLTLDLATVRVPGIWFRQYCEGQPCPTPYPGTPN